MAVFLLGLAKQPRYLQSNCIAEIEGLDSLQNLQYLNLSHNSLSRVQGLQNLHRLETLNLSAS